MGLGPSRGASLTAYASSLIKRKAGQLCRKPGFTPSDREDLAQELTARLLAKEDKYDPGRGASRDTFADRVVCSEVKMILRDRRRLKRAAGLNAASLDTGSTPPSGHRPPVPLMEAATEDDRHRVTGAAGADPAGEKELAEAVGHALSGLPPEAVAVAERLKAGNASAAARGLGVSRRQVYAAIALMKDRLKAAGLGPGAG